MRWRAHRPFANRIETLILSQRIQPAAAIPQKCMSCWLAHRGRLLDDVEISIKFMKTSRGRVRLAVFIWEFPVLAFEQESVYVNAREVQLRITTFDNHCGLYTKGDLSL